MGKRDTQVDAYRGLIMIYIVCFIHIIYWLDYDLEPFSSFVLFEMPIIFFISGASLSLSDKERTFKENLFNRIKRVVWPYYIYAAISIIFLIFLTFLGDTNTDIRKYTIGNILRILLAIDIPQMPYTWHLWFIMPYMIIMCLFSFQQRIMQKINRGGYLVLCICLFLFVSSYEKCPILIKEVLCYNIFVVIGYSYYKKISYEQIIFILFVTGFILLIHKSMGVFLTPMNKHKFSADSIFMFYGFFALCVLSLILSKVKIPNSRLLDIWTKKGYTIYLYQNISYYIFFIIIRNCDLFYPHNLCNFVLSSVIIFIISTLLSYITFTFEQFILKKFLN